MLSFKMLADLKERNTSSNLIRYGIYYYLLSSLATWFLVFVIIKFGKTALYYNTIYFYLHFLYNGFFVFSLFGLLFKIIENQKVEFSEKYKKLFFIYLNVACIPAYVLSILWSNGSPIYYVIGFSASVLQFLSLLILFKLLQQVYSKLKWNFISKLFLNFLIIAYTFKISSQILSSFPYIVEKSMALKNFFIIGYLHLFTLAFMSVFIFLILFKLGKLTMDNLIVKTGIFTFLLGVIITEILLFGQGFLFLSKLNPVMIFGELLLICSCLLVFGIALIILGQFFKNKKIL